MSESDDIAAKVEASSLGTPEAKALRATVSDQHAARIVAMADLIGAVREQHRHFGGGCTGCDWYSRDITKSLRDDHAAHVEAEVRKAVKAHMDAPPSPASPAQPNAETEEKSDEC